MLTWDDEVKPASLASFDGGPSPKHAASKPLTATTPSLREIVQSPLPQKPAPAGVQPQAPAPAPTQRRVNAADKRIINGQTDVKFCAIDDPGCEACQ